MKTPSVLTMMILVAATVSRAQTGGAEAEQLFRDGKRLMREGKIAEACDAFAASQKAEPSVATLLNLAHCRETNGELASAWGLFLEAERQTRNRDDQATFHQTAKDRAAKLEPRLSYLTISVPDESRVDGLELTRNETVVEPGAWNRAIPVDGGDYTISGRAPAHEAWSTTVHVANESASVTVDVPRFKAITELGPPASPVEELRAPPSRWTPKRRAAVVLGAGGLVAVGIGAILGLQGNDLERQALDLCPSNPCGVEAARANVLGDRAERHWFAANVSFGIAGVAVVASGVLWLIGAPRNAPDEVAIAPPSLPT